MPCGQHSVCLCAQVPRPQAPHDVVGPVGLVTVLGPQRSGGVTDEGDGVDAQGEEWLAVGVDEPPLPSRRLLQLEEAPGRI